jgi:predicted Zn-dependent protease
MSLPERIDRAVEATASLFTEPSHRRPAKIAIYLALAAALIWVPYALVHHVYTSGFHVVSVEREERVGTQFAAKLERHMNIMRGDTPTARYVNEVGVNVGREHNPWLADFRFKVIDDPNTINAFALPGGRIYITTGLLNRLDNEAELAMVLAHEIAHVSRRDYARNMGRQMIMSWVKKFLGSTDNTMLQAGSFLTTNVSLLRMRQEDELEADYQGELYIYELDYDPVAGETLIKKLLDLEKRMPESLRVMAVTHPPSRERLEAMRELKETLPEKQGLTLGERRYRENIHR